MGGEASPYTTDPTLPEKRDRLGGSSPSSGLRRSEVRDPQDPQDPTSPWTRHRLGLGLKEDLSGIWTHPEMVFTQALSAAI